MRYASAALDYEALDKVCARVACGFVLDCESCLELAAEIVRPSRFVTRVGDLPEDLLTGARAHCFEPEAERISLELRAELGIGTYGRLDPTALAEHLYIPVRTLADFAMIAREDVRHLLGPGRRAFSAATIRVSRAKRIIITNPSHANTRQMNSLCHETGHVVLDHEAEVPINISGGRAWNGVQEREASAVAVLGTACRNAKQTGSPDVCLSRRSGHGGLLREARAAQGAA